jgi:hypothetical protein
VKRWPALAAALLALAPPVAGAVIVSGGGGDSQPPSPDPGIAHVAIVAGLSGVYLDNGWLLTAGHALTAARNQKKNEVLLDGRSYRLRPESTVRLTGEDGKADLALVRIDGDPGLPALEIAEQSPAVGARLILAGNGPLQETTRSCWDASGHVAPATAPGARCGFLWRKTPEGRTNGLQWGTNQVASRGSILPGPGGTRTRVFLTVFRSGSATPREAQAGVGDSGGPVFVQRNKSFELAGILLGVSAQSTSAATFGDRSYAADLSAYRDEILRVLARE